MYQPKRDAGPYASVECFKATIKLLNTAPAHSATGGRTARNVNPIAWEKGLVMGQCGHCESWHVLSAKNPKIFEEIVYKKQEEMAQSEQKQEAEHQ